MIHGAFNFESGDEGIMYFLSGYGSKNVLRATKCADCEKLLRKDTLAPTISFEEVEEDDEIVLMKEKYISAVNRGGLVNATDLVYIVCNHLHQFQTCLQSAEEAKTFLINSRRASDIFGRAFAHVIEENEETAVLLQAECAKGHNFKDMLPKISRTMFNIFSKKFVAEVNDKLHEARKRATSSKENSSARKLAKLKSEK